MRPLVCLALVLALLCPALATSDEDAIRGIVGKERLQASRVAGDWALALWAEPFGTGGDGVMLLHRSGGQWKKVRAENRFTRAQLLDEKIPEADLAVLGYGDVPSELISSLAYEVKDVAKTHTTWRVATHGRSRFALTNGGDIWVGKQVVWQRIQEKWHPLFSYDGAKTKREARERLYAKQGLSLYMEMLLNYQGETGRLP